MADLHRMDRTWLCSVLFMDIVKYSSQSVDTQVKWKTRFNTYLGEAIQDVPDSERVILDTGDGAPVCFLGAPEAAMFAALHLCQNFVRDKQEQQPGLRVRIGVNLGPVKLVKDLNGSLNAIGDGINAGQRIMSFAPENQILVSQSFYEVVSRLSDDYKALFKLRGVETDKHVREHTVYSLTPPGSEKWQGAAAEESQSGTTLPSADSRGAASESKAAAGNRLQKRSTVILLLGGALVVAAGAVGVWYFVGPRAKTASVEAPRNKAVAESPVKTQEAPPKRASVPGSPPVAPSVKPAAAPARDDDATPAAEPSDSLLPPAGKKAYDLGVVLTDHGKPAEAIPQFDEALRLNPQHVDALLGRAEARRKVGQYDSSIEDCNQVIKLRPKLAKGYYCRGATEGILKQFDPAIRDYTEAIRLNKSFALAYDGRGDTYISLRQYDRALDDLNEAIRLRPDNPLFHMRRGVAFQNLKQFEKAIQDYDQVIKLEPNNARAYTQRANAKAQLGDKRGAAADRRQSKELKQ